MLMRIFAALPILLLGWGVGVAVLDDVPKLNVEQSCEAAAQGAVVAGRNKQACLEDERGALEQVAKNWSQYLLSDKQQCVALINKGGPAGYVELLFCLEVMRDSRSNVASELGGALFENGKLDVRKMDASVLRELGEKAGDGPVEARKPSTGKKRTNQSQ